MFWQRSWSHAFHVQFAFRSNSTHWVNCLFRPRWDDDMWQLPKNTISPCWFSFFEWATRILYRPIAVHAAAYYSCIVEHFGIFGMFTAVDWTEEQVRVKPPTSWAICSYSSELQLSPCERSRLQTVTTAPTTAASTRLQEKMLRCLS